MAITTREPTGWDNTNSYRETARARNKLPASCVARQNHSQIVAIATQAANCKLPAHALQRLNFPQVRSLLYFKKIKHEVQPHSPLETSCCGCPASPDSSALKGEWEFFKIVLQRVDDRQLIFLSALCQFLLYQWNFYKLSRNLAVRSRFSAISIYQNVSLFLYDS